MNIAVILAGGRGSRTEQSVPKQFISIYEKPIIIYTLAVFQKHPDVDGIIVSCIEGWQEVLKSYAAAAGITKLKWIVPGGDSGQTSARNALTTLEGVCNEDDIVIIHDAVRPMVSQKIITDCIEKAEKYGSGLSAVRCQETIMKTDDGVAGQTGIDRNDIMRVQTPQAYRYGKVLWAHKEALNRGITNAVYTNTLMMELGEKLYFSCGSNKNIKITTLEDIDIFKALYATKRDRWLKKKHLEVSDEL
ncbi:MAG: 2-C-methyl-D-erythritol 4-phosphate cytidylyltransferase [Lachnospiraceae bacterium]|nr:2-C-methyl-D-erythritol 4-phosphate cytidylyltransferase [Lachnospiraceae bacterium]MDE7415993.1 2-C-methyl-D-erythritol 4-phosphate cytidylyltransferase [Lachnospiraceae bacterium]